MSKCFQSRADLALFATLSDTKSPAEFWLSGFAYSGYKDWESGSASQRDMLVIVSCDLLFSSAQAADLAPRLHGSSQRRIQII